MLRNCPQNHVTHNPGSIALGLWGPYLVGLRASMAVGLKFVVWV
jgi:hypothetical protein